MTDKERVLDVVRELPDDATIADAIEQLCFLEKLSEGLRQSDRGDVVPHDQIRKQFVK